jgi:head-tail adaptor
MIEIGRLNKWAALQAPTRTVNTEGYTDVWTTYATVRASIEPATASSIERQAGATIQTPITHLVEIWHRDSRAPEDVPGPSGKISVKDRVLFRGRALYIAGMQNPREDNRRLILACEERAA